MSEQYNYSTKIKINRPQNLIYEAFLDYETYKDWQPNLKEVRLIKGAYREENHVVELVYDKDGEEFILTETIVHLSLNKLIVKYGTENTRNRQIHFFDGFGNHTIWTIDTEFTFNEQPPESEERFKKTTLHSMKRFKQYVESI